MKRSELIGLFEANLRVQADRWSDRAAYTLTRQEWMGQLDWDKAQADPTTAERAAALAASAVLCGIADAARATKQQVEEDEAS